MSKTVQIESPAQFSSLLSASRIVVVDCNVPQNSSLYPPTNADAFSFSAVYADWCGPCKAIAPLYEQLSAQLSRPNIITFTKVDTDKQTEVTQNYGITAFVTPALGMGDAGLLANT